MKNLYLDLKPITDNLIDLLFKPTITYQEEIPTNERIILAGNHMSNFDPLLLARGVDRQIHFLAKAELFKGPLKFLMNNIESIPVKRDGNDIYIDLPVTITDLCLGCKKTIKTVDGYVDLKIKEGSQPGDTLRIKGKGINNPDSWKKGDFYCVLKLIIPTSLSRKQKQILEELEDTNLEDSSEFKKFAKLNK